MELPEKLLDEKARDPCSGVDRRQDEERLEHDGEVVPVVHEAAHAGKAAEDLGDADGQRDGAAGPPGDALPDGGLELGQIDGRYSKLREYGGGRVDREV